MNLVNKFQVLVDPIYLQMQDTTIAVDMKILLNTPDTFTQSASLLSSMKTSYWVLCCKNIHFFFQI